MRVNSIVYLEMGIVEQQEGRGGSWRGREKERGRGRREKKGEKEGKGTEMMAAVLQCAAAAQEGQYLVSIGSWFRFVSCRTKITGKH